MQIKNISLPPPKIIFTILLFGILTCVFGTHNVSAVASPSPALLTDMNLEDDHTKWGIFTEVQEEGTSPPTWEKNNVTSPSLDGQALRCAITGGAAYSNVHFYRNLPSDPHSNTFMLSLSFLYRPESTFNNVGGTSIVQALEFTMNKWHEGLRYEWALQWNNVGTGAPGWRYWDPHQPEGQEWVDLNIPDSLEGQVWHTLKLEGEILAGQVHYWRFTIDEQIYSLNHIIVAPAITMDNYKLAVAVQLDGNNLNGTASLSPYELILDKVTFVYVNGTSVDHHIGNKLRGTFLLSFGQSTRQSYTSLNSGPVKVTSARGIPVIATGRVIYKVNGVQTSFSEMMGLPNSKVDKVYYLPWYNNTGLDTQLRIANVSGSSATVKVTIGGQLMGSFNLAAGASTRVSYAVDNGPVKIESTQNIVAAERLIYKVNGVQTSFSEMMALPQKQLDKVYWLPWYNNAGLDTQLCIANVTGSNAQVQVFIGGQQMPGSPFSLGAGASRRLSVPGVNGGPVRIVSDVAIVAAERVIYKVKGVPTSFSEMMALPDSQLDKTYWLPWYNNVGLDTQLRFANVSSARATVHVYIGGQEMNGSPFTLAPGASTRKSFAGIDEGPVEIVSSQNIIAAERTIYQVQGLQTSFSEMMGLPDHLLDTVYWLPWYNSVHLDTQLRFGVP